MSEDVVLRDIARAERAAADALPCSETVEDDGWRLRFNAGVTRRCNSVLADADGADALEDKIARAERFYLARDALPRFQLTAASRPAGLEVALAGRGYRATEGAIVMAARCDDVPAPRGAPEEARVRLDPSPGAAWLAGLGAGSGEDDTALAVRGRTLANLRLPAAFARLDLEGEVAAVGLGVVSDGYLVVFNMATVPRFRRRGAASAVMRALADFGRERGARRALLQVAPGNLGARALYGSLGFAEHHAYDYWQRAGRSP